MHTHHWYEACHPAAELWTTKICRSIDAFLCVDQLLFGPTHSQLSTMEIWVLLSDWSQRIKSSAVEFPTKPGATNSVLGVETSESCERQSPSQLFHKRIQVHFYFGSFWMSALSTFRFLYSSFLILFLSLSDLHLFWFCCQEYEYEDVLENLLKHLVSLHEPQSFKVESHRISVTSWPPASQETIGAPAKTQFSIVPVGFDS